MKKIGICAFILVTMQLGAASANEAAQGIASTRSMTEEANILTISDEAAQNLYELIEPKAMVIQCRGDLVALGKSIACRKKVGTSGTIQYLCALTIFNDGKVSQGPFGCPYPRAGVGN